ncbi:MAG: 50S ribosomal protein L30 [Candidatus Sumerlaeota bacterium]|nr:50S ribosomal protein L30 [Candidatus Sumerlaeota bacterium]
MGEKIRIKWVKSDINALWKHKRTLKALGLRRLNDVVEKAASPQVRGMAYSVRHLIEIEEVP